MLKSSTFLRILALFILIIIWLLPARIGAATHSSRSRLLPLIIPLILLPLLPLFLLVLLILPNLLLSVVDVVVVTLRLIYELLSAVFFTLRWLLFFECARCCL